MLASNTEQPTVLSTTQGKIIRHHKARTCPCWHCFRPLCLVTLIASLTCYLFLTRLLERTIRSAVEEHLFDVSNAGDQSSEDSEPGPSSASSIPTRQRGHQFKKQDDVWHGCDK
jgi:hypothetical protein